MSNASIEADAAPRGRGRIEAVDALRGLAMAAVVVHHVSWRMLVRASLDAPAGPLLATVHLVSQFGVPLFVAVSAFTLAWRPAGWTATLANRARRLLPAYALWSLVSLAARDVSLLAPREVGRSLLFGTADVQFYYVPMLFELLLLWPLLRALVVRRTPAGALVALAGAAAFAELAWRGLVQPHWTPLVFYAVPVATGAALRFVLLPSMRPRALSSGRARGLAGGVLLAVAGVACAAAVVGFLGAETPGADSRATLYQRSLGFGRENALASCALTLALALASGSIAASRAGRVLASLGRASYGVYLVHLLVASTVVYRALRLDASAAASASTAAAGLLAVAVATIGLSWLVTGALARRRALAWTVGGRVGPG